MRRSTEKHNLVPIACWNTLSLPLSVEQAISQQCNGHYESIYHINKECYGFSADGRFCFVAVSFTMGFLIHSLRFATNCQPPDDVRASVQHCVYCVLYAYDKQTAKCARNSYSSHTVNGQRTLLHEFVEYMNKEYISCINGPLKYFSCAFFENSVDVCWLFSV